jgi:cell division protein FtsI/penicillin-binding protein 2
MMAGPWIGSRSGGEVNPVTTASNGAAIDGPAPRGFRVVSLLLLIGVTCLFAVVLGRVAQLQLKPSRQLLEQVTPRVSVKRELPLRGDITDRRGRLLASTRFSQRVIIDPTLVIDLDQTATAIAGAVGGSSEELGAKLMWAMTENARRAKVIADAKASGKLVSEPVEEPEAVEPPAMVDGKYPTSVDDDGGASLIKKPIRYMALSGLLSPEQAEAVRAVIRDKKLKIKGVSLEPQPVREFTGGSEVANIVGLYGWGGEHKTGIEARRDAELNGHVGKVGYVRDAAGAPLWVEEGQIQRATPGGDVPMSIDLEIQRIAIDELTKGVEECDAQGGRVVVMDPESGEILAMADVYRPVSGLVELPVVSRAEYSNRALVRSKASELASSRSRYRLIKPDVDALGKPKLPGLGRNRCVEDLYEPGSTFKPFVWSTIVELGKARPDEVFDTEGGGPWITPTGKAIKDVHGAPSMTWREVLINSSNIGMIKGAMRLTPREFHSGITRFGFGKRTDIGLPGETGGIVTSLENWRVTTHTSMSYGNEVGVTALQMVRAFSAFARNDDLAGTLPRLRINAVRPGEGPGVIYRVLPRKVAELTRETLTHVVEAMEGKYAKAAPDGSPWKYTLFGKSGTARPPAPPFGYLQHQYIPSFIAAGPYESPRLVTLVVIDDPGPERVAKKTYYGAATAGPIVHRILERALTYLGETPSNRDGRGGAGGGPME